ncbi:hypothetical protein SNEBB_009240 [Seison nebaliae]|nr:hypothetical protein SNEBB_009240 [Seison nebaliae]
MSIMGRFLILFICINLNYSLNDTNSDGKRLLVLVDTMTIRETHSIILDGLRDEGFDVHVQTVDDERLQLLRYGEYLYDHILLLAPSVEQFGGDLSTATLNRFVDAGGNIFVAASTEMGNGIRELLAESGVEVDDDNSPLIDHKNFNDKFDVDGNHETIELSTKNLNDGKIITGIDKTTNGKLLFKGTALQMDKENQLLIKVLSGNVESYTGNSDGSRLTEYPHAIGKTAALVVALQARNNARMVMIGSLDFLSNEFIESFPLNGKMSNSLLRWTFKRSGVIRMRQVFHRLATDTNTKSIKSNDAIPSSPEEYTIKEFVQFYGILEQFDKGEWIPMNEKHSVANDLQMEFVRIDPFVRRNMQPSKDVNGRFEVKFQVPDVYGIYTFKVNHERLGYTKIDEAHRVKVRPLTHRQYERFIPSAYPYYASAFSMMIGVYLLSFVVLYHSDEK